MTCCVARPVRPIVFTTEDIGRHQEFAEFDCECGSCCKRVALFAPRPNGIILTDQWAVKIIADIIFGCKKGFCFGGNVEVDFKNGVILDLMGDYVSVAFRVIEVFDNGSGVIPPIALGAMITCCGSGAARGCATRTTELITVADGLINSVVVPIPPFAYAVSFAPQIASQAAFYTSNMVIAQSGSGAVPPGSLSNMTGDKIIDPWTLIGGARSIILTNLTGNSIGVELVFHIGV